MVPTARVTGTHNSVTLGSVTNGAVKERSISIKRLNGDQHDPQIILQTDDLAKAGYLMTRVEGREIVAVIDDNALAAIHMQIEAYFERKRKLADAAEVAAWEQEEIDHANLMRHIEAAR